MGLLGGRKFTRVESDTDAYDSFSLAEESKMYATQRPSLFPPPLISIVNAYCPFTFLSLHHITRLFFPTIRNVITNPHIPTARRRRKVQKITRISTRETHCQQQVLTPANYLVLRHQHQSYDARARARSYRHSLRLPITLRRRRRWCLEERRRNTGKQAA
ncbi:hypothetical protein DM02DRAFT_113252 [Periconia macrospinosa]|uniref:Uncharacterized protein n=1 Tax=Periconia macrospinosa TaxID=97972 RepID=A0A2V1E4L7_9PLEO|nr:hypothetical protein DM02DRAFT_113252 [Periconia macrospinosa]